MNTSTTHTVVKQPFYFRAFEDTPENREKRLPLGKEADVTEVDGKKKFKRKTEVVELLVPTPKFLAENASADDLRALQEILRSAMVDNARPHVDSGVELTPDLIDWNATVKSICNKLDNASGSEAAYPKELLTAIGTQLVEYRKAIGQSEDGANIIKKLIENRFSMLSSVKYMKALPAIQLVLEDFFTSGLSEEEQTDYADVFQYLLKRIEDLLNPPVVKEEDLFAV